MQDLSHWWVKFEDDFGGGLACGFLHNIFFKINSMTPLKHSSDCRILAMDESDWNKASDTDSSYPSIQRAVFFLSKKGKHDQLL